MIELWHADSPVSLNEEEISYIDFTKEFRRYDEDRFSAFQKKCKEERQMKQNETRALLNFHKSAQLEKMIEQPKFQEVRHCQDHKTKNFSITLQETGL